MSVSNKRKESGAIPLANEFAGSLAPMYYGKPYASVKKAMSGVTGIDSCYTAGGKTFLKNRKGFKISVTGLTLKEVEKEIAEIAEGAEYRML